MNRHFGLEPALVLSRRLGPVLCLALALGASSVQAAEDAQDSGVKDGPFASDARPVARADADPSTMARPALEPPPDSSPLPPEPPSAEEPAPAAEPAGSFDFVPGQDSPPFLAQPPQKRTRTKAQARLTGLAAMAARIAKEANLKARGTFEAPRDMVNPSERRVLLRRPESSLLPAKPAAAAPPATVGVLDENIVKEIVQRKTMFRMCYESARRRGVNVTRADVKWILSADGNVRDVVVEVAQDELLSRCIRVVASRPFPTTVPQEIPVAIPLLFVSEQ